MSLTDATLEFFRDRAILNRPGLVAVSGGADSVALAHVLHRSRQGGPLHLVHLNHGLRGAESDGDEAFVRSLPGVWNATDMSVHSNKVDVGALAKAEGWNLEDAGRRARYAFFSDVAARTGATWLATAHTADDQAETLLLRLLRGTGLSGLAGIPEVRPLTNQCMLIRPWLGVRKGEIRAYLAEQNLTWREDASNQSDRFRRNRVRNQLMPMLEQDFQASLVPILNRLARQAREVQGYLSEQAEMVRARAERPRAGAVLVFDVAELIQAPRLLVREMFRLIWQREGWPQADMGLNEWDGLVKVVEGKVRTLNLPGGGHARLKGNVMQIRR